ncbi:MAG: glycosyltransferase [Candidatus Obscuribacterales bacterium]|nr:glycosyltransferase [Cyanobacteria bacterium HKST-UBA01]MCB9466973.1 glycosyltransferase [Candidatus Obscuribacterales bacterium]
MKRIIFAAQPLGPLGEGKGGGVESTLLSLAAGLSARGHAISIVAPRGSRLSGLTGAVKCIEVDGTYPENLLNLDDPDSISIEKESVLTAMWRAIAGLEKDHDLVINFAYDYLGFYLSHFFSIPVYHILSLASCSSMIDKEIEAILEKKPGTVGVHSRSQADSYRFAPKLTIIGNGVDTEFFRFRKCAENAFLYAGRISPEKQIEHALEAAKKIKQPLRIIGRVQDQDYFRRLAKDYEDLDYGGFLSADALVEEIGRARALLITSRALETYCLAAAEAQACGVPVVAYARGSLGEVVDQNRTGYLVEPDNVEALSEALLKTENLDRKNCRDFASKKLSLKSFTDRVEAWIN